MYANHVVLDDAGPAWPQFRHECPHGLQRGIVPGVEANVRDPDEDLLLGLASRGNETSVNIHDVRDREAIARMVYVAERLRERSDIAFVIVGDGPETSIVKKAISARGLTNIHLSPARDDIRTVLADADLVMFASKREGLPVAGIESMSMGKPIVASKVPGWVELVSDGVDGLLVDDGDIAGYANAITRLLGDPALYDRMSRAGREKATRAYDLGDSVRAWERLLAALPIRSRGSCS